MVHTIVSEQELKPPTVLLINPDIVIVKDIRMLSFCLIVFWLSSMLYKIGLKKNLKNAAQEIKGMGWKINKGIFIFLLICLSSIVVAGVAFIIWYLSNWQPING